MLHHLMLLVFKWRVKVLSTLSPPQREKKATCSVDGLKYPSLLLMVKHRALEPFNSQLVNSESERWKKEGRQKVK